MHYKHSAIPAYLSKTESKAVWGQLQLHPSALILATSHIDLTDSTYTVGRFPDCDLSINEQNVSKEILKHISRRHFIMRKLMASGLLIVHVTDLSFNGTFVNGVKIGKNNTFTLFDGDSLAIGKPCFKVFTFRDLSIGSGKSDCQNFESELSSDVFDLRAELTADSSLIRICPNESLQAELTADSSLIRIRPNEPLENDNLDCLRLSW